jgi:hypothetical protein
MPPSGVRDEGPRYRVVPQTDPRARKTIPLRDALAVVWVAQSLIGIALLGWEGGRAERASSEPHASTISAVPRPS